MYYLDEIDGETRQPGEEFLRELADSVRRTVTHMETTGLASMAAQARALRHCLWGKQHWSERALDAKDEAAFPFHGASDLRYRLADMLANQRVAECWTALARCQPAFGSVGGGEGDEAAVFCAKAWTDISRREIPLQWMVQNLLLAQFLHGGGRGVAGMWTGWRRETELRAKRLGQAEALAAWMRLRAQDTAPQAAADAFAFALAEPPEGAPDVLADILRETGLARNARDAKAAAKALRETGECELASEETTADRPELRALCLGDELWIPPETEVGALDDADECHLTEWHTRAGIRAMAAREGWDRQFTAALIGEKDDKGMAGKAAFPYYDFTGGDERSVGRVEHAAMRDRYQLVRTYVRAVGKDGVPARYELLWHPDIKERTARGLRLARTPHGGWPVQLFAAEILNHTALDSRAVPQLAAGMQALGKTAHDTIGNISMLQLPPVVTSGRKGQGDLLLEPLGEIQLSLHGRAEFMRMPQVPYATVQYLEKLDDWRDLYFGLPGKNVPPMLAQAAQGLRVSLWLGQCAETVRRLLGHFVARLPKEALPAALREPGAALPVQLKCDPREWDAEYVAKTAKTIHDLILPLDSRGEFGRSAALRSFVLALMPEHAEAIVRDEAGAAEAELDEEKDNLKAIRAGMRPRIPEGGGADYAGRLAMYREMLAANPAVFDDMAPDKRQLLEEHLAALEQAATQYGENREIGRYGARKEVGAVEA